MTVSRPTSAEERTARALALLDGMADLWFAQSGFERPDLPLPEPFVRMVKQAHVEGLYTGRCSMTDQMAAIPVDQWKIVIDQDVLIYIVHANAAFEKDEARRKEQWECWAVGRWIDHNKGGWTWHGMAGRVTHVAPLPVRPAP